MNIYLNYTASTDQTLLFSSQELSSYLKKMLPQAHIQTTSALVSCHKPDICISLFTDDKALDTDKNDSFQIHITTDGGYIKGTNSLSVLIGVYHYLYLLGCRFLGPTPDCEIIPILKDPLLLFQQASHTASFKHRGICLEGANSLENIVSTINWLPKLGYNSFFLQFQIPYTFLARWYQHEGNPQKKAVPFSHEDAALMTKEIVSEIKKRGLTLHQVGHGWTGACLGVPSSDWKEADLALSDFQHSMLAELNGNRQLFHGIPMNSNLCYSSPTVIHAFAKEVVDYAYKHPEIDYLHVWLADEYNNLCECHTCQEKLLSDQYIDILNEIDRLLTQKGLQTKLVFLLYQELLWPPKTSRFHNPERFVLMFAPISRTFETSYQIGDVLPSIPEFHRNHITLPVNLNENLTFLRAWQKLFSGDSFVYDYPLGRAHYGDFGYQHISRIISDDIEQLNNLKLNGYISCQELRSGLPNFLPNYVMGRKLWDVSLSFESIQKEYMEAAYGSHEQEIMNYLVQLSDLCSCDYFNGKGERINSEIALRMEKAAQLTQSFASTLSDNTKDASNAPVFQKLLTYHCRTYPLLEDALYLLSKGDKENAYRKWNDFCEEICKGENDFQPYLDVYRITEVSQKYTGFSFSNTI